MTRINFTLSEDTLHHLISGDDKGISLLLREVLNQVLEHQRTEQIDEPKPVGACVTATSPGNLLPGSEL